MKWWLKHHPLSTKRMGRLYDPIKKFEEGQFIRTYFNQRSFQRLMFGGNISVQPWKEHLSITASPMLTRYISHGIDYSHCHNIFRVGIGVDFSYGNWLAYGNIIAVKFNLMLDFGRKSREIDIHSNDIDRDSGIMTGTK